MISFEQFVKDYYRYAMEKLSLFPYYYGAIGFVQSQNAPDYSEFYEELEPKDYIAGEIPFKLKENAPLEAYLYVMEFLQVKYPDMAVFKNEKELKNMYDKNVFYKYTIDESVAFNPFLSKQEQEELF